MSLSSATSSYAFTTPSTAVTAALSEPSKTAKESSSSSSSSSTATVPPSTSSAPSSAPSTTERVIKLVESLVRDHDSYLMALNHRLVIQQISWEDTSRSPFSCWGSNISDMTLRVGRFCMPVIRRENYTDLTKDVPIALFNVRYGNETGTTLKTCSLLAYLQNFAKYANPNGTVKGSLLKEGETRVIHSVQACVLPAEAGEKVNFTVNLFNYQSSENRPAVLTIVLSNKGASAQVVTNPYEEDFGRGENLYFNQNGLRCPFVAERLSDVRASKSAPTEPPLSAEESADRILQIVQIPLKLPELKRPAWFSMALGMDVYRSGPVHDDSADGMEDAQISIGIPEGVYCGLRGLTVERDPTADIRVTTQLYRITDRAKITPEEMDKVAADIVKAEAITGEGSLTSRVTTESVSEAVLATKVDPDLFATTPTTATSSSTGAGGAPTATSVPAGAGTGAGVVTGGASSSAKTTTEEDTTKKSAAEVPTKAAVTGGTSVVEA